MKTKISNNPFAFRIYASFPRDGEGTKPRSFGMQHLTPKYDVHPSPSLPPSSSPSPPWPLPIPAATTSPEIVCTFDRWAEEVKRVPLLLESLIMIAKYNIEYTHQRALVQALDGSGRADVGEKVLPWDSLWRVESVRTVVQCLPSYIRIIGKKPMRELTREGSSRSQGNYQLYFMSGRFCERDLSIWSAAQCPSDE
ncbi:hypothetical protein PoB_003267000 [Plakobranchus ocellatus]|uniref:Uncharacterized protein n=1 Tax=Plakobranchus ocellatus TaxID=259542 RepID=A0AAV4AHC9_9GAST|nr:hypothetical protein PoB_003267000 [Plakobranchus ocellatus]